MYSVIYIERNQATEKDTQVDLNYRRQS